MKCKDPCTRCSDATTCIGSYYSCNEAAGLYASGGTCHACAYPCLTCVSNSTNCKTCGFGPENRNGPSSCSCKTGYYHIPEKQVCVKCSLPCTQCTGPETCTAISCNKEAGYYQSGMNCLPCPFPCATCYGGSNACYSTTIFLKTTIFVSTFLFLACGYG